MGRDHAGDRPRRGRLTAGLVAEPWIALLVLGTALVYAAYAVIRHDHFGSGFDLGIFTQAIWHYSLFQTPASTIRGFSNLLGDHFHPIVVLLAPLFWIWSDARTLLIAQAVLIAASTVPVYLFARPRLGRLAAHLLALAYASFWGLGAGAGYEFHEVAFAPLLVALAIRFIDRRRWRAYFVVLVLLLCVKEDLSLFVCFLGVYLLTLREPRRGVITLIAGLAWYELSTRVVIPHFAHGVPFSYWTYSELGRNLGDAFAHVLLAPWKPFTVAFDNSQKTDTMLYLFLPFLGLTLCSRLALLTLPLLAERFLSTNSQLWVPEFHYSLAVAPVLAMGAAAGLANLARLSGVRWRPRVAVAGAAAMVVSGLLVGGVLMPVPIAPWRLMVKPAFYRAPAYADPLERALDHIPAQAPVVAPDFLIPHVAARAAAYDLSPQVGNPPGFLIVGLVQQVGSLGEHTSFRDYEQDVERRLPLYQATFYEDGWIVLRRRPNGTAGGRTGILIPIPRRRAARLLAADATWQVDLARAEGGLRACGPALLRGEPSGRACLSGVGAPFLAESALLGRELLAALPELVGGCRQLGELALAGAGQIASDIQRLRTAGPGQATADLVAYSGHVNDLDLPGQLTRFLELCDPRPLSRAAAG